MVWLKNEERLKLDMMQKYRVVGNGTELSINNIDYADTGAYMCQASNTGGVTRDISSLIVQEILTPSEYGAVGSKSNEIYQIFCANNKNFNNYIIMHHINIILVAFLQPRRKKNAGFSLFTTGECLFTSPPLAGSTIKSSPRTSYPELRYILFACSVGTVLLMP